MYFFCNSSSSSLSTVHCSAPGYTISCALPNMTCASNCGWGALTMTALWWFAAVNVFPCFTKNPWAMGLNTDKKSQTRIATTCTSYVFQAPSQKQNYVFYHSGNACCQVLCWSTLVFICQCTTTAPFSMVTWFPGALGFPQSFEPPFPTHDGSEVGKLAVATKMPEENLPNVYQKKTKQSTGCQHIIKSTSNPFKMMDTKTDTCYYAIAIPRILWARIIQPVEKKHTEISVRKL